MPKSFAIQPYGSYAKSFLIDGPLPLEIDNDDVPSAEVAALAQHLVELLNRYWEDPVAYYCENEDCQNYYEPHPNPASNCPLCGDFYQGRKVSL